MDKIFFTRWDPLIRTVIIGALAYITLIVILRISGKRTLSKMNAFDLVVTVALGSTLATALLDRNVALAEGALAFVILVGLQFVVTWTGVRVQWVHDIVTGQPSLLLYQGAFLPQALKKARVTEAEIRAAIRSQGLYDMSEAEAVVLETDGSLSVVCHKEQSGGATSLLDVKMPSQADLESP